MKMSLKVYLKLFEIEIKLQVFRTENLFIEVFGKGEVSVISKVNTVKLNFFVN